jgi:hypothetical protein
MTNNTQHYAGKFGLPVEQVKFYNELTTEQRERVAYRFGGYRPDNHVYAVKRDGGLVSQRFTKTGVTWI